MPLKVISFAYGSIILPQDARPHCRASGHERRIARGEVEVDESYFGGVRKGKRGRGALGKIPAFGLLKRGGKVYVMPIPDAKATTLMPIIRKKIQPDRIV